MPWRQPLLYQRFVSIFISGRSCQRNCSVFVKTSQKTLSSFQATLVQSVKKSSFCPDLSLSRYSRRPSSQRLSTLQQYQLLGSCPCTSSPSLCVSESCGHLPFHELMDKDVTNTSCIPSSTLPDDRTEVSLPILHHHSGFLQLQLPERDKEGESNTYALVILNHELPLLTVFLWSKACCRICADGGANRIYDWMPTLFPMEDPIKVRKRYIPDVIKGDLDSIRVEVREFYSGLGTKVLDNSEDQDSTDLHKCVAYAIGSMRAVEKGYVKILVLGAMGGRLDHEFANLNILYLFKEVRIVLFSDESMAYLLPKGYKHEISIDLSLEGPYCGLLPLGGPSLSTTTTGLKWNLDKSSLEFGGLISTSNMPICNTVTVASDADLVWTISIQRLHSLLKERVNSLNKVSP